MLKKNNQGLTLLEIVISMSILSVMVIAIAHFQGASLQFSEATKDKEFAARKAVSMLEEIRSLVERAPDLNEALASIVDEEENSILTLHETNDPSHPLSGNVQTMRGDGSTVFKFSRRIELERFGGSVNANVKMARVTISLHNKDGSVTPIVGVGTIIQAPLQIFPPSQVYDVYLVTAESSPSWWVHMSQTRGNFESQLIDLMSRNPGLTFRSHFITANGYGRNPMYLPYVNEALPSAQDPMAFGYIYPGTHSYTDGTSNLGNPGMYYFHDIFQARYNLDGTLQNDFAGQDALDDPQPEVQFNPFPHAFCDRFNQDMRYPDALDYFNKKQQARRDYQARRREYLLERAQEIKTFGSSDKKLGDMPELSDEEPSWRILLEQMVTSPEKFHNAIVLNLHGELLPLPAIRNYSDAAKDPEDTTTGNDPENDLAGVRVVTHPEKIWNRINTTTPLLSDDVKLRVYSYVSDMDKYDNSFHDPGNAAENEDRLRKPITIVIKNVDLTARVNDPVNPSLKIERIFGGYQWTKATLGNPDGVDYGKDLAPFLKAATDTEDQEDLASKSIHPNEMYVRYRVLKIDTNADLVPDVFHTVLYLYNSPLGCKEASSGGCGLDSNRRLYGLEYIPNPVVPPTAADNFPRELHDPGLNNRFKNTARWVITIPKQSIISGAIDNIIDPNGTLENVTIGQEAFHQLRIETRIGTDLGQPSNDPNEQFTAGVGIQRGSINEILNHSGTMYPPERRFKPENLSVTYAWWTSNLGRIPYTEMFQYMGDPRHSPYADNCVEVPGLSSIANGYNAYWDNVDSSTNNNRWSFINSEATNDGWGPDRIEIDLPRYQQLVRRAIVNSELLYTTLTGFSYFYVSVGGEIGVDGANGFPKSVQVRDFPFGGSGGGTRFVDEYAGHGSTGNGQIHYIKKERGSNDFPLLFWLGELYHDDDYNAQWGQEITNLKGVAPDANAIVPAQLIGGNIVARNGNDNYLRVRRDDNAFIADSSGTGNLNSGCRHRLRSSGCGAIIHAQNSDGRIFTHHFADANSQIRPDGEALATEYSLPLPNTIFSTRPWNVRGFTNGDQFDMVNHNSVWRDSGFVMLQGAPIRTYYHHSGSGQDIKIASGLLLLQRNPGAVNLPTALTDPFFRVNNNGYVAVNGLNTASEEGVATINKLSLLTLLHSFLELGADYQTRMLPRLRVIAPDPTEPLPNDPTTVQSKWEIDFRRWDGKTYTPAFGANTYPPADDEGFPFRPGREDQELDNLFFVPMITDDLTLPWVDLIQLQQGETDENIILRQSGQRPDDPTGEFDDYRVGGQVSRNFDGEYVFNIDLSDRDRFPTGTYFFRVECFRLNEEQHFAFHQVLLEIKR